MIITYNKSKTRYFTNDSSRYCYIPIYKNAHTFGKQYFYHIADFDEVEKFTGNKEFIIFLRNPINRWFSGVAEYFSINTSLKGRMTNINAEPVGYSEIRKNITLTEPILKLVFNAVHLDVHTDLQILSILGLNTDRCTFFNLDDQNFEYNLNYFTIHRMKKTLPNMYKQTQSWRGLYKNRSQDDAFKNDIINQLKLAADANKILASHVYNYYKADIDLIKSINFYKA